MVLTSLLSMTVV